MTGVRNPEGGCDAPFPRGGDYRQPLHFQVFYFMPRSGSEDAAAAGRALNVKRRNVNVLGFAGRASLSLLCGYSRETITELA